MVRSNKCKSNMFFCSHGHVSSHDKLERLYFNFPEAMSTKLETDMAYEKVVTWLVKNLYFHIARDYQTRQDDGNGPPRTNSTRWWQRATTHKAAWQDDGTGPPRTKPHDSLIMCLCYIYVIICCLVTKKKCYISNTASSMDTKFDRVEASKQLN